MATATKPEQIELLEQEAKNCDTLAQMCRMRAMGRHEWAPAYSQRAVNYRERAERLRIEAVTWRRQR